MKPLTNFALIGFAALAVGDASAEALCKNRAGAVYDLGGQCVGRFQPIDAKAVGLQGPAGPAGAQGTQGPQGPQGSSAPFDCSPYTGSHIFNYSPTITTAGQNVTIGGVGYQIVTMPFIDFTTGSHYSITYPTLNVLCTAAKCETTSGVSTTLTTKHLNQAWVQKCGTAIQTGVSILGAITDTLTYASVPLGGTSPTNLVIGGIQNATFSASINDTFIQMNYSFTSNYQNSVIDNSLRDYTNAITWGNILHPDGTIQYLRTLMNYITIQKLN